MTEEKQKFIELLAESGAVQFGDFTAKSGRKTPFFINTGKLMYGDQLDLLSRMYAQTYVENIGRESRLLFGPAYKGITLIAVTAAALYRQYGVRAPICFNRKEKKDHGEGGVFVGKIPEEGDRIVIVEDVITAGTAIRESLNLMKDHGKGRHHLRGPAGKGAGCRIRPGGAWPGIRYQDLPYRHHPGSGRPPAQPGDQRKSLS